MQEPTPSTNLEPVAVTLGFIFTCPSCRCTCGDRQEEVSLGPDGPQALREPKVVMCGHCLIAFEADVEQDPLGPDSDS